MISSRIHQTCQLPVTNPNSQYKLSAENEWKIPLRVELQLDMRDILGMFKVKGDTATFDTLT